jgi:hypothetical protein
MAMHNRKKGARFKVHFSLKRARSPTPSSSCARREKSPGGQGMNLFDRDKL